MEADKTNLQVKSRITLPKINERANDYMKYKIFPYLRDDTVTKEAVNDELIVTFGNLMAMKYSSSAHHYKEIRNKIRHIGRILLEMKLININIKNAEDIFAPENFDDFVKVVHKIAGLE